MCLASCLLQREAFERWGVMADYERAYLTMQARLPPIRLVCLLLVPVACCRQRKTKQCQCQVFHVCGCSHDLSAQVSRRV